MRVPEHIHNFLNIVIVATSANLQYLFVDVPGNSGCVVPVFANKSSRLSIGERQVRHDIQNYLQKSKINYISTK